VRGSPLGRQVGRRTSPSAAWRRRRPEPAAGRQRRAWPSWAARRQQPLGRARRSPVRTTPKAKSSTAASLRAGEAAASAPVAPAGATKSRAAASATAGGKTARRSRPAIGTTPIRESSVPRSQATHFAPPFRRSMSTAGSASASCGSSAATRLADKIEISSPFFLIMH